MNSGSVGRLMFFLALAATLSAVSSSAATDMPFIIHGPSTLYPGEQGTYSIETPLAGRVRAGVDVAVSDGTLTYGKDHYTFSYTMPESAAISSRHTIAADSAIFNVTAVGPPSPSSSDTIAVG